MQKFLCQFTELRTVAFMEIMIFCVKDVEWEEISVGEQWHSIEMMAYFKFKSELQSHTYRHTTISHMSQQKWKIFRINWNS